MPWLRAFCVAAAGSQFLAFWFMNGRKSPAKLVLVACMLLMAGAVVFQVPTQLVLATYEKLKISRIRILSAYSSHGNRIWSTCDGMTLLETHDLPVALGLSLTVIPTLLFGYRFVYRPRDLTYLSHEAIVRRN
jgi:hypothetical protein